MKVVLKTDEYTIFQRRDQRYAIRDANKAWVNGDGKVAILLEHKLIEAAAPKKAEPAPAAEAEQAPAAEAEQQPAAEAPEEPTEDAVTDAEPEKDDK